MKLVNLIPNNFNINEAKDTDVSSIIKTIEKYTDRNDHTASVLELAKFLKDTKSMQTLQAVKQIHDIEGSMPSEIAKYRSNILNDLMNKVKSKYGQDIHKQFNSAF